MQRLEGIGWVVAIPNSFFTHTFLRLRKDHAKLKFIEVSFTGQPEDAITLRFEEERC